jgi:NAD-dependent dihydropyrimidine dehydrogenase PreA subunit
MAGLRYLEDAITLEYDPGKCTGCQLCTFVCPHGVFAMRGNRAELIDRGACMECGACQLNCAFDAIHVQSGVGCAAAIIASWFNGGTAACGPADATSGEAGCDESAVRGGAGCC